MKKNQNGFSTIVLAVVILILATVGFAGWKVYESNREADSNSNATHSGATKTYTDTANKFTFTYPSDWSTTFAEKGGTEGPAQPDPDWAKVSRPVVVKPAEGEKDNNVTVKPGCETVSSNGKTVTVLQNLKDRKDQFHTQEDIKVNSYNGFYDRLDFRGDAETYLDHTYFITNDKDCVVFSFRENWHHDMSNTNFDDSKNVPGFKSLVESIKFLD